LKAEVAEATDGGYQRRDFCTIGHGIAAVTTKRLRRATDAETGGLDDATTGIAPAGTVHT
jgi:hypothetical protein